LLILCLAVAITLSVERDFCNTRVVSQSAVEREIKKINKYKTVNQAYITDCINDARKRREQCGSVVQSYTMGNRSTVVRGIMITQEIIANIAVVSDND